MTENLEQVEQTLRINPFMQHIHIEQLHAGGDKAGFVLHIFPDSLNPYGVVHGGAIYALADNTAGVAAHSDGRFYVTQNSAMHFLRNQAEGDVTAKAFVRHRGHATCLVRVDVTGEGDKLIATGDFTFFCVDKTVMDTKRADR